MPMMKFLLPNQMNHLFYVMPAKLPWFISAHACSCPTWSLFFTFIWIKIRLWTAVKFCLRKVLWVIFIWSFWGSDKLKLTTVTFIGVNLQYSIKIHSHNNINISHFDHTFSVFCSLFGHTEEEYIPDAESVYLHRQQHHQPQACTLAQCFQLYTKEEQVQTSRQICFHSVVSHEKNIN